MVEYRDRLFEYDFGSRVYGTYGPESDYDHRFVYILHLNDYLSPRKRNTSMEHSENINNELHNYYGWEITHYLSLVQKSIPNAVEFNEVRVLNSKGFDVFTKFFEFQQKVFCLNAYAYAVAGNLHNLNKQYLYGDKVPVKKYLEACRLCNRLQDAFNGVYSNDHVFRPKSQDELLILGYKKSGEKSMDRLKSVDERLKHFVTKDIFEDIKESIPKKEQNNSDLDYLCQDIILGYYDL